jgi:hypothetical protein
MELNMATSKFQSKSGFPLHVIVVSLVVPLPDTYQNIRISAHAQVLMLNINAGTMRVRILDNENVVQLTASGESWIGEIPNNWIGRTDHISAQQFFDQVKIVKS